MENRLKGLPTNGTNSPLPYSTHDITPHIGGSDRRQPTVKFEQEMIRGLSRQESDESFVSGGPLDAQIRKIDIMPALHK